MFSSAARIDEYTNHHRNFPTVNQVVHHILHFIEVHVATELDVCEGRDVKGLYAKARRGEITSFTGIDDPYEAPLAPEIQLDTNQLSIEEAGRLVLAYLERVAPTRTTRN